MDSNKQGFPHGVGGIFRICFFGEGLESIQWGEHGGFQEKGKYFINICTVACRLKNFIFLLN